VSASTLNTNYRVVEREFEPFRFQVQKKGWFGWYDIADPDGGAYFHTLDEAVKWCEAQGKPENVVWP
jgi:hypothetical protein